MIEKSVISIGEKVLGVTFKTVICTTFIMGGSAKFHLRKM